MTKTYRINEIFYSLQGEGRWAGRPAVFVRFSGCNLKCPFCDTDFSEYREMVVEEILSEIALLSDHCRFVVLTGGEPTLQLDETLIESLHSRGYFIAIETNGTHHYPWNVDWVTFSPKDAYVNNAQPVISYADEIKIVFDGEHDVSDYGVRACHKYLQPCDTGDKVKNAKITERLVDFLLDNPEWSMSLQQQKIINVK